MKSIYPLIFILAFVSSTFGQETNYKMKTLFNGNDLNKWQVPDDNVWWTIDGDVLWAKSDPDQKGSILWTKKEYNDFVVQLEFKFGEGTVDSGIFMRGEDESNVQIQIGISGSLKRDMTGSPYVPRSGYPIEANGVNELLKMDDWNIIKAMTIGNSYKVWLNGEEVMNYILEKANLEGPVGLQLHPGRDMTIQFKNISIAEL